MTRTVRAAPLLGLVLLLLAAPPLAAQEPVSLEQVSELTRVGRTEEARELLLAWWDQGRAEASRRDRQRALWLRGRLTVDPAQAELDFRRLVIEYPGGAFSDRALLRLAQGAWARGDVERAEQHLEQLGRDYPGSPVVREARTWRSEAGSAPPPPPQESAEERVGPVRPDAAVEAVVDPVAPEVSDEDPVPEPEPAPDAVEEGRYAVQLGAFAGEGRARALRDRVAAAGYDARLVRIGGSRLLHVRVGRFVDEEDAQALLQEIRGLGLTAALVRDADQEETSR